MTKSGDTKMVLVIEDEADMRQFVSRVLELEGYHVLQAADDEAGLRLLREGGISLVLLDLRLSAHDGWTLLVQMKASPELRAIPVIVFTASADISLRHRALAMGAVDYLVKPLSAARLRTSVGCVLHGKE
ncbi:MAG: response regulator [Chloroflexota bacterium]|nr:response regulator [Chloroflexota bacterium]